MALLQVKSPFDENGGVASYAMPVCQTLLAPAINPC